MGYGQFPEVFPPPILSRLAPWNPTSKSRINLGLSFVNSLNTFSRRRL